MKEISAEMTERNIEVLFLDVWDYVKDESTKEVDVESMIQAIRNIGPQMMFIVICYSQILDLRFALEQSGILSEVKLNRDLKIQSRGNILTLSEVQKEFLQTVAKAENITKRIIEIRGQVGSGKTLLGIEVLKMKVAHYLRKHGLNAEQGKEQIRALIVLSAGESEDLKTHIERELFEDIGKQAQLEVHNEYLGPETLNVIIENQLDFAKFKETIILVDECGIDKLNRYTAKELEEKLNMDYIHCIKYRDLGKKSQILE